MGRYLKIPGVPILVFVVLTLTHNPNLNLMLSLLSPALSSGGREGANPICCESSSPRARSSDRAGLASGGEGGSSTFSRE